MSRIPQERTTEVWRKSSYSGGGNTCVEVGTLAKGRAIRDTRHRHLGHLTIPTTEWSAFLHALRHDEL